VEAPPFECLAALHGHPDARYLEENYAQVINPVTTETKSAA